MSGSIASTTVLNGGVSDEARLGARLAVAHGLAHGSVDRVCRFLRNIARGRLDPRVRRRRYPDRLYGGLSRLVGIHDHDVPVIAKNPTIPTT